MQAGWRQSSFPLVRLRLHRRPHGARHLGRVSGSTITWTVPLKTLGKGYKAGTLLEGLGAQTRGFIWLAGQTVPVPLLGNTTGFTVPQLDHATSTAVFKIGS